MFFRPTADPAPNSLRLPSLAFPQQPNINTRSLPLSSFQLNLVPGAEDVSRLEVRDADGVELMTLTEGRPLPVLGGGWRGGTTGIVRWAVAVGVAVPDLTYLTFLSGRRARASGRISMTPSRIGPYWYVECAVDATGVDVVVAGRSTGVQPLRSWTAARL